MCDQWMPLRWDSDTYERNHLNITRKDWERSIARAWTATKNSKSKYNPNVPRTRIEELELECARGEAGEAILPITNTKRFYRRVDDVDLLGRPIGASNGQFTEFIFVIVQRDGSVHGYPITKEELKSKKGVAT